MLTLTREQVRQVDRLAIDELGLPGAVLMENAGRNAAAAALEHLRNHRQLEPTRLRASVLCGAGNNGGDGYVIARHLHNHGARVRLFAFKPPDELTGDAAVFCNVCQRMRLPIEVMRDRAAIAAATERWRGSDLIVDALLGTGFAGEVREPMASAIAQLNTLRDASPPPTVLAVDVPSGLDCDSGEPAAATVRADLTVTFVAAKIGFLTDTARPWLGELTVADIGAPPELIARVSAPPGPI